MSLKPLKKNDVGKLFDYLQKTGFDYFSLNKLINHISENNFYFLKLEEKKSLLGFVIIEEIEEGIARISTIPFGRQKEKNNEMLILNALKELKENTIQQAVLYIKEDDFETKKLCKRLGFTFSGKIQTDTGELIEEFECDLEDGCTNYIS